MEYDFRRECERSIRTDRRTIINYENNDEEDGDDGNNKLITIIINIITVRELTIRNGHIQNCNIKIIIMKI